MITSPRFVVQLHDATRLPRSPGQASAGALAQRGVAGAGRLARGWAVGLRHHVSMGGTWLSPTSKLRRELTGRGVKVSDIRHKSPVDDWKGGWELGADPQRRDYASFADFADPDGNTWVLQEICYRRGIHRG